MTREEIREQVRHRADHRCEYCRLPDVLPDTLRFHLEHIVARQHGGQTELANLAWACQRCNNLKGPNLAAIDPDTGDSVSLFHPRRDRWEDHFRFEELSIIGQTRVARATIWLLEMNSEQRIRWRAALRRHGLF